MTALLIAGGSCCAGEPLHTLREWAVDAERRLYLTDLRTSGLGSSRRVLPLPIPGSARPVACDGHRKMVVLENGAAYRFTDDIKWRPLTSECEDMKKPDGPAFTAGGSSCGSLWLSDTERHIWTWRPAGRAKLSEGPVPGKGRILGVDVPTATVLLEDGCRWTLVGGRWLALPGVAEADGKVRLVVTRGRHLGPRWGDVSPGDVLEVSEADARDLLRQGVVAPAPAVTA